MLNRIPRCSGQETGARKYVQQVADAAGATWKEDERGNVVVYVPARGGVDSAGSVVAVQAHLDMVCEKRPEVEHDFSGDPIRPRRDGDRIFASGTTLGADNGIGAAASLALLTRPDVRHGPLELIFTVEEETGLHGALALERSLLHARWLINLDSENPDELIVGSAGAAAVVVRFPFDAEITPDSWIGCEVTISGLKGGHSGLQIHERHANAIKLIARVLTKIRDAGIRFSLASIEGGGLGNTIPRTATARVSIAPELAPELKSIIARVADTLRSEWRRDEPDLTLSLAPTSVQDRAMANRRRDSLLSLLDDLPHGVVAMSGSFPDKVETSANLAGVQVQNGEIEILLNNRSVMEAALREVQSGISALGKAAGANVEAEEGYPAWEPEVHSRLVELTEKVYEQVYGRRPEIQIMHGGLECGVIVPKVPGMEAISFGPLIRCAHTSEEHVYATTVTPTWELLITLLEALGK